VFRALTITSCLITTGLLISATAQVRNSVNAAPSTASQLQTIVSRMEQAEEASRSRTVPYNVTRQYQLANASEKPSSEVLANVSFTPPGQVEYVIQRSSGSARAEKIVRGILEHEARLAAQAVRDGRVPTAVNEQNYKFAYLGQQVVDGQPCYVLQLTPKHKEEFLIAGNAYVDSQKYQIRRIEGDLSKSPSWWLKSVHVTLSFGEVGGMWLQNSTRAVADVRMLGEHTLTSRALNYQVAESVAQNGATVAKPTMAAKRISRRRPSVMLGAGVMAPR
jgi:hypothetical protein